MVRTLSGAPFKVVGVRIPKMPESRLGTAGARINNVVGSNWEACTDGGDTLVSRFQDPITLKVGYHVEVPSRFETEYRVFGNGVRTITTADIVLGIESQGNQATNSYHMLIELEIIM